MPSPSAAAAAVPAAVAGVGVRCLVNRAPAAAVAGTEAAVGAVDEGEVHMWWNRAAPLIGS